MLKKIIKLRFNLAALISILFFSLFSSIFIEAMLSFNAYKKAVDPKMELTLDRFHFFFKNKIKEQWTKITSPKPLSDKDSPLKTFHITIAQAELNSLNENLPESGKDHYVEGYLKVSDDKKVKKIKLRYRGDQNFHWLNKQKSLRIKLAENDIYNMEKKLNIVNPPHIFSIIDSVNYEFSKELNIISPDYYPVRTFINGQYMGVYMYLSQADESLLRKYKRMPGSIYAGDGAPEGKTVKVNGVWQLWKEPSYWKKIASRNAEQENNRDDINFFIDKVNSNGLEFYNFFNRYLDKDKFYNYFALDTVFGSHHHDVHHNHKIYFDPYKGTFEPIEWDLRFWTDSKNKDTSIYKLINKVKLNPILEYERDKVAYSLMTKGGLLVDNILEKLKYYSSLQRSDLVSDVNRDHAWMHKLFPTWISTPYSMKELDKSINSFSNILKNRRYFLIEKYNNTSLKYKQEGIKYIFKVEGNSPVIIDFSKLSLNVYKDTNFNGVHDTYDIKVNKEEIIYPGRSIRKDISTNWPDILKKIESAPLYYTFFIDDAVHKKISAINAISGEKLKAINENFNLNNKSNSIHPWKIATRKIKEIILSGRVEINETVVYGKNTAITIAQNTVFILEEGVSIFFYGKIEALGKKGKPIKFIAKDPKKPWGTISVQGKATTGSRFEYVEIENGSVDTHNLIHYTSPFNIHNSDWFEVRHCKIGRNFVGDDAMHIAYSKGIVDSTEFTYAKSDALDIDISNVEITNNIFYKSGNDGLDIMTTMMNASNNVFIDTGDKGISVGEWSEADITDSFFLRTYIGTEIKDKSKVNANNLIYIDSVKTAINLYNKNKRYDAGGTLNAETIYLTGNTKVIADKFSQKKIKHRIEKTIPSLSAYRWYENLQNTPYKKIIEAIEMKYAE